MWSKKVIKKSNLPELNWRDVTFHTDISLLEKKPMETRLRDEFASIMCGEINLEPSINHFGEIIAEEWVSANQQIIEKGD